MPLFTYDTHSIINTEKFAPSHYFTDLTVHSVCKWPTVMQMGSRRLSQVHSHMITAERSKYRGLPILPFLFLFFFARHVQCNCLQRNLQHTILHTTMNRYTTYKVLKTTLIYPPLCRYGARLNIKTIFTRYGDSHVKDKTVGRPSYL